MQCKVAMFSISPRKWFPSFGSLFPSHFDSLLPAQVLQSVIAFQRLALLSPLGHWRMELLSLCHY